MRQKDHDNDITMITYKIKTVFKILSSLYKMYTKNGKKLRI